MNSRIVSVSVILAIVLITVGLALGTRDINFWPSDSYAPYHPTASRLFQLDHLSQMHDLPLPGLNQLNMRGKEALILGIALVQKILHDTRTLYPNILLLIIAHAVSSLLVYLIMARTFDQRSGVLAFILFAAGAWPYVYILLGAHQPLVLMFFLLTVFCLLSAGRHALYPLAGGLALGMMLFSSPTAIMYFPYFLLFVCFAGNNWRPLNLPPRLLRHALLLLCGTTAVFLIFLWPHPLAGLKKFGHFVFQSQAGNHFDYYRNFLLSRIPEAELQRFAAKPFFRGAGWIWIMKYMFLMAPFAVMFYVLSILVWTRLFAKSKALMGCVLISLSTPILVEISQVAQIGRNYFSWLPGILFISGAACKAFRDHADQFPPLVRKVLPWLGTGLIVLHVWGGLWAFFTDIYPTRMATARADQWLEDRNVTEMFVYRRHPYNLFAAGVMNNPKRPRNVRFLGIDNLLQPDKGLILIPPTSGETIFVNCAEADFVEDPFLTQALKAGLLADMAAVSFDTVTGSRIWRQEEEVCAYRDLILDQIRPIDPAAMQIHILDVKKIQAVKDRLLKGAYFKGEQDASFSP